MDHLSSWGLPASKDYFLLPLFGRFIESRSNGNQWSEPGNKTTQAIKDTLKQMIIVVITTNFIFLTFLSVSFELKHCQLLRLKSSVIVKQIQFFLCVQFLSYHTASRRSPYWSKIHSNFYTLKTKTKAPTTTPCNVWNDAPTSFQWSRERGWTTNVENLHFLLAQKQFTDLITIASSFVTRNK